jgi:hypothetical protein
MSNEKALLMQGFFVSAVPQSRRSVDWRVEAQSIGMVRGGIAIIQEVTRRWYARRTGREKDEG